MSLITANEALKKTKTVYNKMFSYKTLVNYVEDLINESVEIGDSVISMDLSGFSNKNINTLVKSLKKLGYEAYTYLNEEDVNTNPYLELIVEWG